MLILNSIEVKLMKSLITVVIKFVYRKNFLPAILSKVRKQKYHQE